MSNATAATYSMTRRDRQDRAGFFATLAAGRVRFGWQPFCLAFAGVDPARVAAALEVVKPHGRGETDSIYEGASAASYARKVGAPSNVLALIDAVYDASDRPEIVCAALSAALA